MNWKDFLTDVSKTVMGSTDLLEEFSVEDDQKWLGYSPASDTDIKKSEARLATTLPPSYKAFLKESNGFKQLSCFTWNILPVEKVDWLKYFDTEFHNLYATEFNDFNVTDEVYFTYGETQKSVDFRSEYLTKTLAISGWGDSAILLLNPEVKFGDEWEAWMFANWYPGATRYKSFEELMITEYADYLRLLNDKT